jgi:stalled ribosome rescue protein Dom34
LAGEFLSYLQSNASKLNLTAAFQGRKFTTGRVSSAYPQELDTLLEQPEMAQYVQNLKVAVQARAWGEFMKTLNNEGNFTSIGEKFVLQDARMGAVKTLLVTDEHIMKKPFADRIAFLDERDRLIKSGGTVVTFSVRTPSGEQLKAMGGIVAVLKFAVEHEAEPEENAEFD